MCPALPTWLLVSQAMILAQMSTSVWRRSVAVVCSSFSTYGKMPTAAGRKEGQSAWGEGHSRCRAVPCSAQGLAHPELTQSDPSLPCPAIPSQPPGLPHRTALVYTPDSARSTAQAPMSRKRPSSTSARSRCTWLSNTCGTKTVAG